MSRAFLDSNVLVYAFGRGDPVKTSRSLALLHRRGVLSVQSLNEFANVARRKLGMNWDEIDSALATIQRRCQKIVAVDEAVHREGLRIARDYRLSIYDAMLIAAAMSAACELFWSEDMQDGLVVDGRLRIVDPFAAVAGA